VIIATAGHVDHGKTSLIKALTGTDTDRLPEEKTRGLSIDLGFAYQALPDNITLGFVDVPGHEKFIRNMLAGVGGIDLGLLVVAADDGVMPQTREHFSILDLLGINKYVVTITKIDRVDDNRVLEIQKQVEILLGDAGHKAIAIYPLCAPKNIGVDQLKKYLSESARKLSKRSCEGHFRMAIDRAFTLKGVGLVITGMVFDGIVNIDDNLMLSSDESQVRVRGIKTHNEVSDRAQAGERCAVNIVGRGISKNSIKRGDWLMHSSLHAPTRRIDVDLRVLDSETKALKHWTPTHLHIGAEHLLARVAVLSGGSIIPSGQGLAQLVLEQDVFVVHGDHFVLRDQSAQRTIAGGHVIDPFGPKRGRARPTRIAILQAMDHHVPRDGLNALSNISESGVLLKSFAISHNLTTGKVEDIIGSLSLIRIGKHPHEWVFSTKQWQNLLNRIEKTVGVFHSIKPEQPGASLKDIQLALKPHVTISILKDAMEFLVNKQRLGQRGSRFHLLTHSARFSELDRQLWAKASAYLAPNSGSPLSLHQAAEVLGIDNKALETALKNAVKAGEMVLVAKNRYLPASYMERQGFAAEKLAESTIDHVFTVAEYCKEIKTGRNFAIDLLEYFDNLGFTGRLGNNRRIIRPAAIVFAVKGNGLRGRESHPGGAPGLQTR